MNKNEHLDLYFHALRIRKIEEKIADLYREQEMRCPVHLSIGQEAPSVSVCRNLKKSDYVFSNHRSHGHYLAKGGNLKAMLAEIYGKSTGCSKGFGGSMHLIDAAKGFMGAVPIVASAISLAVGAALKFKMKKERRISVSFFGDGAVEEGIFYESLNFASLHKLPILFVCENNMYSICTPLRDRQPQREIYKLAISHKIKSVQLKERDLLYLYAELKKLIERIREGKGPILVEILTYRWREHCGPNFDNDLGYRSEKEFLKWKARDPLEKTRRLLYKKNLLNGRMEEKINKKIDIEIENAVKFAKKSPFPCRKDFDNRLLYA
ncbi:MAG: thiamine pyrophosphate-dependent dehydrogenase E1 component subunit alpha [Elusimicrobia bacterium]|nr:thiamine pyrophosphate-dependent dehydrogenase E1 component subunit alpha [Elusimicrobiota bacterium]